MRNYWFKASTTHAWDLPPTRDVQESWRCVLRAHAPPLFFFFPPSPFPSQFLYLGISKAHARGSLSTANAPNAPPRCAFNTAPAQSSPLLLRRQSFPPSGVAQVHLSRVWAVWSGAEAGDDVFRLVGTLWLSAPSSQACRSIDHSVLA